MGSERARDRGIDLHHGISHGSGHIGRKGAVDVVGGELRWPLHLELSMTKVRLESSAGRV